MQHQHYTIRYARQPDLVTLPDIERAAATRFRNTRYAALVDETDTAPVSANVDLEHERVWIVDDPFDQPVGFAIVHLFDTSVHLHELDVHPAHAGRGLGRQLIETVAAWARDRGARALTLTTFADIPWNGPYYARLGFHTLNVAALSPSLQKVRQEECDAGLPMAQRICMQLDL
jgi:GNAT superfamily N-acetyltransferase